MYYEEIWSKQESYGHLSRLVRMIQYSLSLSSIILLMKRESIILL